ncbi:hypothetical protein [Streptomyces flaveus]|uniref:DNA-binding protein n=1 Tax=Streptomyces flaveus TaxID=66370 RepID=A0A917QRZ1_9ACTN|nr:hypothetical protein [Streptomyces flaveus]GGK65487.1 hypothetical protein GCM10010094_28140 [Streptomyces flaveus]
MAGPERLEGRNGRIWRAYILGATQEAIAAEHDISRQRVGQVLEEIRSSIPAADRADAALVDLERLDVLLSGVMPAAIAGDTQAARAVLAILERRAKMLRLDLEEPLRVTLERRLDLEGALIGEALGAALDAVPQLSHEQRVAALTAAQAKLLGEEPPAPAAPAPVEESKPDLMDDYRKFCEAEGIDPDEDDDQEDDDDDDER